MIQKATGKITDSVYASGHYIYPGYLIRGEKKNLMVEAGFNLLGPAYLEGIQSYFGHDMVPDYCFATQSHYDHLGALPYLKAAMPKMAIGASPKVARLLQKESVISKMNFFSAQLGEYFKEEIPVTYENTDIRPFEVDLELAQGDVIDFGNFHCRVYETPGHTKDHLSFWIPELSLLFPGEALGNPAGDGNEVKVEFVSSYTDYLNSIDQLRVLNPKIIAMSHMYVYTGRDAPLFMERSRKSTIQYRQLIEAYLDEVHGDLDAACDLMAKKEYDEKGSILMERNAYVANLRAQVKAVYRVSSECSVF